MCITKSSHSCMSLHMQYLETTKVWLIDIHQLVFCMVCIIKCILSIDLSKYWFHYLLHMVSDLIFSLKKNIIFSKIIGTTTGWNVPIEHFFKYCSISCFNTVTDLGISFAWVERLSVNSHGSFIVEKPSETWFVVSTK